MERSIQDFEALTALLPAPYRLRGGGRSAEVLFEDLLVCGVEFDPFVLSVRLEVELRVNVNELHREAELEGKWCTGLLENHAIPQWEAHIFLFEPEEIAGGCAAAGNWTADEPRYCYSRFGRRDVASADEAWAVIEQVRRLRKYYW